MAFSRKTRARIAGIVATGTLLTGAVIIPQVAIAFNDTVTATAHLIIKGKRRENIEATKHRLPLNVELVRLKDDVPNAFSLDAARIDERWRGAVPLDDVLATFKDLSNVGCQILTIGQYLRPSQDHAPMTRYYTPAEFAELKQAALEMGFVQVESGSLVRSSYHANETADAYAEAAAR